MGVRHLDVFVLDRFHQRGHAVVVLVVDRAARLDQHLSALALALRRRDQRGVAVLVDARGGDAVGQQLAQTVDVALAHLLEELG